MRKTLLAAAVCLSPATWPALAYGQAVVLTPIRPTAEQMQLLRKEQRPAAAPAAPAPVAAAAAPAPAPVQPPPPPAIDATTAAYMMDRAAAEVAARARASAPALAPAKGRAGKTATTHAVEVADGRVASVTEAYRQSLVNPATTPIVENGVVKFMPEDPAPVVLAALNKVATLEFEPDEVVEHFEAGDQLNWEIRGFVGSRPILLVKPKTAALDTNLVVFTSKPNGDRRSYNLILRTAAHDGNSMARYGFIHRGPMVPRTLAPNPAFQQRQVAAAAPAAQQVAAPSAPASDMDMPGLDKLDWNYEVIGKAPFAPNLVATDGTRTWLRLPDGIQDRPILMVQRADGKTEVANVNANKPGWLLVDTKVLRAKLVLSYEGKELSVEVRHRSVSKASGLGSFFNQGG